MTENIKKYIEYLKARGQSLNYADRMKTWLDYLQVKQLEIFTQETITQFFNENEYSLKTRNLFISAGRDYYSTFLQIPKEQNEWFNIKLMKVAYNIPNYLSLEELQEIIKYLKTYHSNTYSIPKIEVVFIFLFVTGVRKTEFLTLKREDFDLANNKVKVLGKGRKERYVYYTEIVKKEIIHYFKTEPEEINAFNLTSNQLLHMAKLAGKALGKKVHLHLLRHSSARYMTMRDIPINIIQKILGHNSIQTTLRYTEPDAKMIESKYKEKME